MPRGGKQVPRQGSPSREDSRQGGRDPEMLGHEFETEFVDHDAPLASLTPPFPIHQLPPQSHQYWERAAYGKQPRSSVSYAANFPLQLALDAMHEREDTRRGAHRQRASAPTRAVREGMSDVQQSQRELRHSQPWQAPYSIETPPENLLFTADGPMMQVHHHQIRQVLEQPSRRNSLSNPNAARGETAEEEAAAYALAAAIETAAAAAAIGTDADEEHHHYPHHQLRGGEHRPLPVGDSVLWEGAGLPPVPEALTLRDEVHGTNLGSIEASSTDTATPSSTGRRNKGEKRSLGIGKSGKPIRNRQRWLESEDEAIFRGLLKHGWGQWTKIRLEFSGFGINPTRTSVDIKDRCRNLKLSESNYLAKIEERMNQQDQD
ncbi:hypothetical protein FVE85_0500 [Porphyridium purpureum]|uniref:Uncharacterized protein n=1 Tax=Porphyridium purpureum TaxID=35688 RepID=A0A5J4YYT0_PORPP|nr:hypothetical protein FVE85_0500 [Porphyridium purpureum]|eukprot:POR9849..scf208_2